MSEDGQPLDGVKLMMRQLTSDRRSVKIEVKDASGEDGVVIDRILPFGDYYTTIKTAEGWYASLRDVPVQFAKGLELTIVAPSPGKPAKLEITSAAKFADLESLRNLRFGVLERHYSPKSRGYSPQQTPEPDTDVGRYDTFPSPANGIEEVAVGIKFDIERHDIPHPIASSEDEHLKWSWIPDHLATRQYLLVDAAARLIEEVDALHGRPDKDSTYFQLPSDRYRVGAVACQLGQPQSLPLKIDVPAGHIRVLLTGFYGRPSGAVARELNVDPESKPSSELWLTTNVIEDSRWASRVTNSNDWFYTKPTVTHYEHAVRQEKELLAGDTLSVSFGNPEKATE